MADPLHAVRSGERTRTGGAKAGAPWGRCLFTAPKAWGHATMATQTSAMRADQVAPASRVARLSVPSDDDARSPSISRHQEPASRRAPDVSGWRLFRVLRRRRA